MNLLLNVFQSVLKKLELEKNLYLPFLIVNVKNLPDVTLLLFFCFCIGLQLTINKVIIFPLFKLSSLLLSLLLSFFSSFFLSKLFKQQYKLMPEG